MTTPHAQTHKLCGAKTRSGKPCEGLAMANGRCRMHGGNARGGVASATFVHGNRSKYLPKNIMGKYEELADDPALMQLRDDVAIVTSLLNDRLEKLETGEAAKLWERARKSNDDIRKALNSENFAGMDQATKDLDRIIGEGLTIHEILNEVQNLIDQRRRLIESEQKRLTMAQQMITSEQAMVFVAAIVDTVRRNVTDRDALQAISMDISKLTMLGAGVNKE